MGTPELDVNTELNPPEPFMKGRFNLFNTPDGGILIMYQPDAVGDEDTVVEHIEIPGPVMQTLRAMGDGKMNPMKAMKAMAGFMGMGR